MPKIMKNILFSLTILFSPFAAASNWVQVNDWATPLKVNPNSLEQKLWSFVATESKVKFQPKDTYTFQYKTINDSELYINALCNTHGASDLTSEFIVVFDAGSCYFQATYNFKTGVFVKLEVNGEA